MKPPGGALTAVSPRVVLPTTSKSPIPDGGFTVAGVFSLAATLKPPRQRRFCLRVSCTSENSDARTAATEYSSQFGVLASEPRAGIESLNFEVRSPSSPLSLIPRPKLSLSDQALLLLAFIGCTVISFRLRKLISFSNLFGFVVYMKDCELMICRLLLHSLALLLQLCQHYL